MLSIHSSMIFREYFLCQSLLDTVSNVSFYVSVDSIDSKRKTDDRTRQMVSRVLDHAKEIGFDQRKFTMHFQAYVDASKLRKRPPNDLAVFLTSHIKRLRREIGTIPNSIDKTYDALRGIISVNDPFGSDQVFDAMVLLGDEIASDDIAPIVQSWKEAAKSHRERQENYSSPSMRSEIFWISRDFQDTINAVSRYRFHEHFGIGEFPSTFTEVESMFATAFLEHSSMLEPESTKANTLRGEGHGEAAFDLWLVSRSRNLPNKIRDVIEIMLRRISKYQFPEGYWGGWLQLSERKRRLSNHPPNYLPDIYVTALWSLNLLKLSVSEQLRYKGVLGARWLLEKQNSDGSWSYLKQKSLKKVVFKPDLFVTLLCLEVIVRSKIENVTHTIDLGVKWIMSQQDKMGMWDDDGFPAPFMTVLVLEFLKRNKVYSLKLDSYLSMSRDFINRSVQFSLEESSNSRRLAIIAAHHGIEAFLYSALSQPSVNMKIFEKPDETIGMRKALTAFQTHLQNIGKLRRDETIPLRNSLDRLAYLRDEIVHKGIDITPTDCQPIVEDASRFTSKFSLEIFGYDIWT